MLKLKFEEINSLFHGISRVEYCEDRILPIRFTLEQQELYKSVSKDFYKKSFATAGVSLEFETDSESLAFAVTVNPGSSRTFFTHSIFLNNKRIGELSGNIGKDKNVDFEGSFCLPSGMKKIRIVFPWSVASSVRHLEIDDNAGIFPVKKSRKILMFGDSITQGYDALLPENSYASLIAREFYAEVINKGIGGEKFFAELGKTKDDFEPDLITVAYGTNDWRHRAKADFEVSCKDFFAGLQSLYSDVKILAVTPIWRADCGEKTVMGVPFSYISDYIKGIANEIPNLYAVEGINLVPHNRSFYQTDGLHPIDNGFLCYFNNLRDMIVRYL